MLSINDLRSGVTILEAGDPWVVVAADFMKKAQRRPVMRTKLRNLRTGQVVDRTFKQGDSIPEAEVGKVKAQFLYEAGGEYTFMDRDTFEQYGLQAGSIGAASGFLSAGTAVDLITFGGGPIAVQLPIKMTRRVTSAPPGIRGDSASNISQDVVLEGGMKVRAPLFVREGDLVLVDTRTGEYAGKASEA